MFLTALCANNFCYVPLMPSKSISSWISYKYSARGHWSLLICGIYQPTVKPNIFPLEISALDRFFYTDVAYFLNKLSKLISLFYILLSTLYSHIWLLDYGTHFKLTIVSFIWLIKSPLLLRRNTINCDSLILFHKSLIISYID